jgi:AAA family ATP:ADP antiporter
MRLLRLQDTTATERTAALWTGIAFFSVLFSYYLLRPVRETIGFAFGTEQLLWLFALTFVLTALLNLPYMALASRLPSRRFVPLVLHGFALSFLLFAWIFHGMPAELGKLTWGSWQGATCGLFYSWLTAFTVCGVTLVWVHAVEWFSSAQGKRLFSLIAIGGTLGAIAGSATTHWLAALPRHVAWLRTDFHSLCTVLGAAAIEIGLLCWWMSLRACRRMHQEKPPAAWMAQRTGVRNGLQLLFASRYLLGLAGFVMLSTLAATTFYFQQNELMQQLPERAAQTQFGASINLWQNVLSLLFQLFFTSRALLVLGLGPVLCAMPLVSTLGLLTLAWLPLVAVYGVIEVTRRMLQYAFDKPAREVLYTPLLLDEKYKAKAFIDTAVLRCGDLVAAAINALLIAQGVSGRALAFGAVPVFAGWAVLGLWLGRQCRRREAARA